MTGAPSLKSLARKTCIRYIRNLESIGDLPIALVTSIINRIDNAEQLRRLEENSPQTIGHTKEAWINLLKRDIPNFESKMPGPDWRDTIFAPENADRWWKVYSKLRREKEREKKQADAKLAAVLGGIREKRDEDTSQVVKSRPLKSSATGVNRFKSASYTMNRDMYVNRPGAGDGKSFFEKLSRNASSKAAARRVAPVAAKPNFLTRTPVKAPVGLVEDLKAKREMERREVENQREAERIERDGGQMKMRVPKRRRVGNGPAPPLHGGASGYDLMSDREARLKRLKEGNGSVAHAAKMQSNTRLTEDFLENDSDDDDSGERHASDDAGHDDLFGSEVASPPTKATSKHLSPNSQSSHKNLDLHPARAASPLKRSASPMTNSSKPVLKRKRDAPTLFRTAAR